MSGRTIILGTRGSGLALAQTGRVRELLLERRRDLRIEVRIIHTEGDADRSSPLKDFGGRGAFVRAIETAILEGSVDAGVHSLKDLPSRLPEGLHLAAVPEREDPRDVLVARDGLAFHDLPPGAEIGTGSDRRRIQAAAIRPDLVWRPVRGNIGTRLRKIGAGGLDGVMLARAGLVRLGLGGRAVQVFEPEEILPAPCQGALGLECRAADDEVIEALGAIENADARLCVDVERTFIAALGLGCHAPVAALAVRAGGSIRFAAFAADDSGRTVKRTVETAAEGAVERARSLAAEFKRELA